MSHGNPDLGDVYRQHIERISDATYRHLGQRPTIARPPAAEQEILAVGRNLDVDFHRDLVELYRVTDGLIGLDYRIPPLDSLIEIHVSISDFLADYEVNNELGSMLWGPAPQGPVIGLGDSGVQLLLEVDGPCAGELRVLDGGNDQGFRWLGPSLEAMLDAWACIAESGLIMIRESPGVGPIAAADSSRTAELRTVIATTRCSPACAFIFDSKPSDE